MMVSPAFRNRAETMQKSKNRNRAETVMKPMRNHAETAAETIERNRETIPIRGGRNGFAPSRARLPTQSGRPASRLRFAEAPLRRLARPEKGDILK
jgi:hypothetical protein